MTELSPETMDLLRRGREGAALSPNRRNRLKTTILAQIAATAIAPAAAAGVASSATATGTVATATGTVATAAGTVATAAGTVASATGAVGGVAASAASAGAGWTSFLTAVIVGMSGTAVGAGVIHWASAPEEQKPMATVVSEPHNAPVHKSAASKWERRNRSDDEIREQQAQESVGPSASVAQHALEPQHALDGQHPLELQHAIDPTVISVAEATVQQGDQEKRREETHREVRARGDTSKPLSASEPLAANAESWITEPPESMPVAQNIVSVPQQITSAEPNPSMPRESTPRLAAEALKEEAQLLRQAHDALTNGNATEALKILEHCAARFPNGPLAPERSAERIFALCRAGRFQEAQLAANQFLHTYSVGPLAARVRSSCAREVH